MPRPTLPFGADPQFALRYKAGLALAQVLTITAWILFLRAPARYSLTAALVSAPALLLLLASYTLGERDLHRRRRSAAESEPGAARA